MIRTLASVWFSKERGILSSVRLDAMLKLLPIMLRVQIVGIKFVKFSEICKIHII